MKLRLPILFLVAVCGIGLSAQSQPALSETDTLRAENLRLRFALLQQQEAMLRTEAQKLETERVAFEALFRQTLNALPGQTFNWQTLRFDGPPTGAASPTPSGAATGAPAPKSGGKPPERRQP